MCESSDLLDLQRITIQCLQRGSIFEKLGEKKNLQEIKNLEEECEDFVILYDIASPFSLTTVLMFHTTDERRRYR